MVRKHWGRKDQIDVIPLKGDGFLFKFIDSAIMTWVFEGGPWFIASLSLDLQKWQSSLTLEKLYLTKFSIWVV